MGIAMIRELSAAIPLSPPDTVTSVQRLGQHADDGPLFGSMSIDGSQAALAVALPASFDARAATGVAASAMRPIERRLRRAAAAVVSEPIESATVAAPFIAATRAVRAQSAAPPATSSPARAAAPEAAVLERLNLSLTEWVDEDKARAYLDRPSDLLRAVAKQRHRIVPDAFSSTLDPSLLTDEAVLDEAALLHHRLHSRTATAGTGMPVSATGLPSLSALRERFLEALDADYAKRRALDALFVPSPSLGQTTPYFDGFALRNLEGKSFDDLIQSQALWSDPALSALTVEQRRALLSQKFDEMAESTQFSMGSVPHSLATAVLRIDRYRGALPTVPGDEAAVVKALMQREGGWNSGESYPYHPRLLFAMHLARSSGIDVTSVEQLRLVYENQVSDPALESMYAGNDNAAAWIEHYLSGWEARGVRWKEGTPAQQAQVLVGLFDALRAAADEDGPVSAFAREIRAKGVLIPNRIVGADLEERAAATLAYGNERLLAAYGEPPRFDRREAAAAILRRHGVDNAALTDARRYVIVGDNPNVMKAAFGDAVDEFLDRADWVGLNGASMTVGGGASLKPREDLEREEEAFNDSLVSNPWVVAMAKERLRAQAKPTTHEATRRVADEIASNLAAETEVHRALVKGLDTWINTLPIAGPIYNIEEGVRHKDALRAAFGLLFLAADGFDLSMRSGGARAEGVHPVVPKLRRALGRIDGSSANMAGHPEMIEMSADPVLIGRRDADVPAQLRSLAREARANRNVRWRDYDVVHLDEEDRIVPIRRDGDVYRAVDWHTGHRLREVSAIELDAQTGWGRMPSPGVRPDERFVLGVDVAERLTVQGVKSLLGRANDLKPRHFDELFGESFALPSLAANRSQFAAASFYRKLYESSDTFRRVFNHYAQVDARARNRTAGPWKKWEFAIGEAAPLGAPSKAYTDFEHKRIYMPSDAAIKATSYLSADGPKAMTPEQAYLHEAIHALTGARDPERALDMLNRGPTVYLTDKILSEAGYAIPEQIMYRRRNSLSDMPIDQTVEYHASMAARAGEVENRYLDALIDAKRTAVTADTLIEGMPVASRATVADTKAMLDAIEDEQDGLFLTWSNFKTKFDNNFAFYVQDRTMTSELASDAMVVMDFYGRLYERSVTFRRMFDKMSVIDATQARPWRFVLEGDIEFDRLSPTARVHGAAEPNKKIYVLDDGSSYLTETGLREAEVERKLTYAMICAMTGLPKLPRAQSFANRGAAVFLTDRILKEAGFNYPRQLAAALVAAEDAATRMQLLAHQTSAMRSAALEDRYLVLG